MSCNLVFVYVARHFLTPARTVQIHSWKDEGITEPWMYEDVFPLVRSAILFRYQLISYLYCLAHVAHLKVCIGDVLTVVGAPHHAAVALSLSR